MRANVCSRADHVSVADRVLANRVERGGALDPSIGLLALSDARMVQRQHRWLSVELNRDRRDAIVANDIDSHDVDRHLADRRRILVRVRATEKAVRRTSNLRPVELPRADVEADLGGIDAPDVGDRVHHIGGSSNNGSKRRFVDRDPWPVRIDREVEGLRPGHAAVVGYAQRRLIGAVERRFVERWIVEVHRGTKRRRRLRLACEERFDRLACKDDLPTRRNTIDGVEFGDRKGGEDVANGHAAGEDRPAHRRTDNPDVGTEVEQGIHRHGRVPGRIDLTLNAKVLLRDEGIRAGIAGRLGSHNGE